MNTLLLLVMLTFTPGLNFFTALLPANVSLPPLVLAFEQPAHSVADDANHADPQDMANMTDEAIIEQMEREIQSNNWAESFLFLAVDLGIITITIGLLLSFYRILRGPQLADRVLAGDTFAFHVVALVILLAIRLRTEVFFDAALVVAIIGFASTLAFAQYIGTRRKRTAAP